MRSNISKVIPQDSRDDIFLPSQGMSGNKMGMYGNPAIADRGMTKSKRDVMPSPAALKHGAGGGYHDSVYGPDDTGEPDDKLQGFMSLAAEAAGDKKTNPVDDMKRRANSVDDDLLKKKKAIRYHAWPPYQGSVSGQTHYTHTVEMKSMMWPKKTPAGKPIIGPDGKPVFGYGRRLLKVERGHVYWHMFDKPKRYEFDSGNAFMEFLEKYPNLGLTKDDLHGSGNKLWTTTKGRWSSSKQPPGGSITAMLDKAKKQAAKAHGVQMADDERNREDLKKSQAGGDPGKDRIKAKSEPRKVVRRRKKTEGANISKERLQEIIREEVAAYYNI